MKKFNDQSERKQNGSHGFLVTQTAVKRHEHKNGKQRSTNEQK